MTGKKVSGYAGHGPQAQWLNIFIKYKGEPDFWDNDGDGLVRNKKKDMFRDFLKDAGVVAYNKNAPGDKYTKYIPTDFGKTIIKLGANNDTAWALMLCNLVYTPDYNWYTLNLDLNRIYTPEELKLLLKDELPNDASDHGKENVINALKIALIKTPFGTGKIFGQADVDIKTDSGGNEKIKLNSLMRVAWDNPIPEVILYSLYKFAEACGTEEDKFSHYQFSLSNLLDDTIERDGVSPTRIFGLDREIMTRILNALSINYPALINASFTLGLETITLRDNKTSADVLAVF